MPANNNVIRLHLTVGEHEDGNPILVIADMRLALKYGDDFGCALHAIAEMLTDKLASGWSLHEPERVTYGPTLTVVRGGAAEVPSDQGGNDESA